MRILIVEDSPADRDLLKYLLEDLFKEEAKFRDADNLETAFRYLEMGNFDCVLLDLQLPDSAGKETFEKIIARFPDVPAIIMTHTKDRDLAIEMIRAGALDFIQKSYTDPEDIFRRILFAVEKHRRTVRMTPEEAAYVHRLERTKADMLAAYEEGDEEAIKNTTVATALAAADVSRKIFTELQSLSARLAKQDAQQEHLTKSVKTLETEVLKGTSSTHSMKSRLEIAERRLDLAELKGGDHGKGTS